MRILPLSFVVISLFLSGCATSGRSWPVFDWFFGRKAAAVDSKEEKKSTATKEAEEAAAKLRKQGQAELAKGQLAIEAAKRENPDSRPVEVAGRFIGNASGIYGQVDGSLSLEAMQEAQAIVLGMLSEETAKREEAERRQIKTEKENIGLSRELGEAKDKISKIELELIKARKEASEEAKENLVLANELRISRVISAVSTFLSIAATIGAVLYRYNLGGLQDAVGRGLAMLENKYGMKDEDVISLRSAIDAKTTQATQKAIGRAFLQFRD